MREVTTNEFTNILATLDEPVAVKRYTRIVGVFYPTGTETVAPSQADQEAVIKAAAEQIEALQVEVVRLKQLLAEPKSLPPGHHPPFAPDDLGELFDRGLTTDQNKTQQQYASQVLQRAFPQKGRER